MLAIKEMQGHLAVTRKLGLAGLYPKRVGLVREQRGTGFPARVESGMATFA